VLPKTIIGLRGDCLPPLAVDRIGIFTRQPGGRVNPRRGQMQAYWVAISKIALSILVIWFLLKESKTGLLQIYYILII